METKNINFVSDNFGIRSMVAKSFAIAAATTSTTPASRSSMGQKASAGLALVKSGSVSASKDKLLVSSIRDFADGDVVDRQLTLRNLLLKALTVTFPKMDFNVALAMASVKAMFMRRESRCASWTLEGNSTYVGGAQAGWKNMQFSQSYKSAVSGFGIIQWTADRNLNIMKRIQSLQGQGFDPNLAMIDPVFQCYYWAAEMAEHAGLNQAINGNSNQSGIFFTQQFADVLQGKGTITTGEIFGVFLLWQMGAGFGMDSEDKKNALIYGSRTMYCGQWKGGLLAMDLYNAFKSNLVGYFEPAMTLTVNDFCAGITKFAKKHATFKPRDSYFFKKITTDKKGAPVFDTFLVRPSDNLIQIFNLY